MQIDVLPQWLPKDEIDSLSSRFGLFKLPPSPLLALSSDSSRQPDDAELHFLNPLHSNPEGFATAPVGSMATEHVAKLAAIEMASYDFREASLIDSGAAASVVAHEAAFERAVAISVMSGRFENAYELVTHSLLLDSPTTDPETVRARMLSILRRSAGGTTWTAHKFRKVLFKAIADIGEGAAAPSPSTIHMTVGSGEYTKFTQRVIASFPELKRAIGRTIEEQHYHAHRNLFEEIVALAEDRLPQLVKRAEKLLRSNPERVVELLKEWGPEGWGIACREGTQAPPLDDFVKGRLNRIQRELAKGMCDDDFGALAATVPFELFHEYPSHIERIINAAEKYQRAAFAKLNSRILGSFEAGTVSKVIGFSQNEAELSNRGLDKLATAYSGDAKRVNVLVRGITDRVLWTIPKLLTHAPTDLFSAQKSEGFCNVIAEYRTVTWALCKQFGRKTVEYVTRPSYRAKIQHIRETFGYGAADYLAYSFPAEWGESEINLHRATFGLAAGQTLKSGHVWKGLLSYPDRLEILRFAAREFNLRSFHRYAYASPSTVDLSLLRQNIDNLTPAMRSDLPLALVVYAEDDHNDAFGQAYRMLAKLSKRYKVIFVEASCTADLVRHLERFGSPEFAPNGISLLFIGGHGSPAGLLWRRKNRPEEEDQRLHFEDFKGLNRFTCFAPHSVLVWGMCNAAFPLQEGTSFLDESLRAFPVSLAVGSQRFAGIQDLTYNQLGQVDGAKYTCARRRIRRVELPIWNGEGFDQEFANTGW